MIEFISDYHLCYSNKEEMNNDLEIDFQGQGWYSKGGDTTLILVHGDTYIVHVFLSRNGKNEMKKAASLPSRNF